LLAQLVVEALAGLSEILTRDEMHDGIRLNWWLLHLPIHGVPVMHSDSTRLDELTQSKLRATSELVRQFLGPNSVVKQICDDIGYKYRNRVYNPMVNKRVYRIWRQEGLKVPRKRRKKRSVGTAANACHRMRATHAGHVWSWGFIFDRTENNSQNSCPTSG
jgi:hypothetical protein